MPSHFFGGEAAMHQQEPGDDLSDRARLGMAVRDTGMFSSLGMEPKIVFVMSD
jgi:hypothetical protein